MPIRRFANDVRGATAVIFALALVPMLASVGAAVDYGRATAARESLRTAGDQAAIAIASADNPTQAASMLLRLQTQAAQSLASSRAVTLTGGWVNASDYRVVASARVDMAIVQAIPGMPREIAITTETVARRIPPVYQVLPPRTSLLEPEAADYNRAYLYCYDPLWRTKDANDPAKGRRDFVPIADNATPPTDFAKEYEKANNGKAEKDKKEYKLPECVGGEVVAYMMRNVRNARTSPSRWDTDRDYYEYFTDTEVDPNTGSMLNRYVGEYIDGNRRRSAVDLTNRPMLETILCDSEQQCKPTSQGGILPTRRTNRDPAVATGACTSGKLMYYGYEDRPGGDRDYDDIRIIVSCPELKKVQDKQVRIIR